MNISINGDDAVFQTSYDDNYDLLQIFNGILPSPSLRRNGPVNFRAAGLKRKSCRDIWHMDLVFSFATDEVPPLFINGYDAGGNHGCTACVQAMVPAHGLNLSDLALDWTDEAGTIWTLLRVVTPDELMFISAPQNGQFVLKIDGALTQGEKKLVPLSQHPQDMHRAVRHIERAIYALKDGAWSRVYHDAEDAECAEIREIYEVMDPLLVTPTLKAMRPANGFTEEPDLAIGEPLARAEYVYRIQNDGTILIKLHILPRADALLGWIMGTMYQEKCELGGGTLRYIPGLKPFDGFDFSHHPVNTSEGPFPEGHFFLGPDKWENPDFPPDRQIDFIRTPDGKVATAFAFGYLPVGDGAPEIRRKTIGEAFTLVSSRKTYPSFYGSYNGMNPTPTPIEPGRELRGVLYRKYFPATLEDVHYDIHYEGVTYSFRDKLA